MVVLVQGRVSQTWAVGVGHVKVRRDVEVARLRRSASLKLVQNVFLLISGLDYND